MTPFQKLVEEKILEAMDNGEFNNLPGKGRPLELEDDSHVPQELRMTYRLLKRAGIAPEEVLAYKEVNALRTQLIEDSRLSPEDKERIKKELRVKELESNLRFERFKKMYFGL
jgi:hypothetical protein